MFFSWVFLRTWGVWRLRWHRMSWMKHFIFYSVVFFFYGLIWTPVCWLFRENAATLLSWEAPEIFCDCVAGWFQPHAPKLVMRDTRCETLIKVSRYLYALPWDLMHRNTSSKQCDKLTPLPQMRPWLLCQERPPWPQGHRKKRGEISQKTLIETLHVDLDVRASCQWGGGLWELAVMCARIINLNTIKKLRGIKATVMR